METLAFDLEAYANTPIYIAFVHENHSTDAYQTDDWYLDNVYVRPYQEASFNRAEVIWQYDVPVKISSAVNRPFLGFNVRIAGDEGTVGLSNMKFTTEGTDGSLDISKAVLYTTYDEPFISHDDDGVLADVFGEVDNPSYNFEINGGQTLTRGDNFFWLSYAFNAESQPEYPYPRADATLEALVIDSVTYTSVEDTVIVSPYIVPDEIPNEWFDNAIELPGPGLYGSYNVMAGYELEHDVLAYCAPGSFPDGVMDAANSVWWYFKAPNEGLISADLSKSNFNTILLFTDENDNQVACNDDIEAGLVQQSRITGYPVSEGEVIYIRVSGVGQPGDPNGSSGIVAMEFEFSSLTGIGGEGERPFISLPYPNPASGMVSFEIELQQAKAFQVAVLDMMGRPFENILPKGLPPAGAQTLQLDVSHWPTGTYFLQVWSEDGLEGTRKLVVAR